jgi:hypothetical protein
MKKKIIELYSHDHILVSKFLDYIYKRETELIKDHIKNFDDTIVELKVCMPKATK